MSQRLDGIDRKIIDALQNDARTPFTEIGVELGISDATVHFRVKKMLKAGVIKKYTVVVNESVLGRSVAGYMLMKVKPRSIEEVSKRLGSIESVTLIQELHGPSDIIVKIGTTNLEKLRDVVREIQMIPKIVASEYFTIFKTWKK
ncbi:Lrp/AsnC family transcriptional regulator [Candidatus Bathyarchaeota archaeon]|nr:Lrp/AsnC family transcriptional regulator [Candidatus Bathyarchaeota archaeon]